MKPLLFLDCETTGLDGSRLVELAWATEDAPIQSLRVKPPVPIELEATVVNHITNRMVESLCTFEEHPSYKEIKDLIEASTVVAHNASFDIGVLNREGIYPTHFIDTKRLATYTHPEIKKQNLQYLRYALDLDVEAQAHSAEGDVKVLKTLFYVLSQKLSTGELDEFVDMV